jgi:ADP-ribose pyrophosphatase
MNLNWKKLSERLVWDGYRKVLNRTFELPSGERHSFEINATPDVACVLALTESQNVILVRQYRPGPERVLLEMPGGMVDAGESPEVAAARELLEETGYVGDVRVAGSCFSGAYTTRTKYACVATNCRKVGEQRLGRDEFIEVVELPLAEFRQHLRSGQLTDVEVGYLGLDYLKLL